jgi:hypothetical protein
MRALLLATVVAAIGAFAPASALGADIPPYDGLMAFGTINGPADPEEFSWEVKLEEDEELRQVDDRHAGVYWKDDETLAMQITAQAAHDADGATVPTTIAVTQPNVITLTVHHRAGNPAAGGAPFDYPISAGVGWEGGFQTHEAVMPPPETVVVVDPPFGRCAVPSLDGRSLKAARKLLAKARCKLGPIRGERGKGAKVVKQFRRPGKSLPLGAEVGVKLG